MDTNCGLCLCTKQEYQLLVEVLDGALAGDSIFLLGDLKAHKDHCSETCKGVIRRNG